jgi:F-type H+-transporting ATPase subunit alpha
VELLKQGQYSPVPVEKQILVIYAGGNGFFDDLELEQCKAFEDGLNKFVENAHPAMLSTIREKKTLDDALKAEMTAAITEFKTRFLQEQKSR